MPAVPTRSAFTVTLYSPGYTIEREKGNFMRRYVVLLELTSAYIGWLCGGGGQCLTLDEGALHRVGQRRDNENFYAFSAGAYTTT